MTNDLILLKKELILPYACFLNTPGIGSDMEQSEERHRQELQQGIVYEFLVNDDMTVEDFVDEQESAGLLDLGTDEYIDQILDAIEPVIFKIQQDSK